jgi:predicted  nucleic acid-binding Zn-ribbon protein
MLILHLCQAPSLHSSIGYQAGDIRAQSGFHALGEDHELYQRKSAKTNEMLGRKIDDAIRDQAKNQKNVTNRLSALERELSEIEARLSNSAEAGPQELVPVRDDLARTERKLKKLERKAMTVRG